jgi:hypothetical protein
MSKIETLFEDKKTAKKLQVIYFTAKPNEPSQPKTKVKDLTTKVYKKREKTTGGEKSPRKDRLENTDHQRPAIRTNPPQFRGQEYLAPEREILSVIGANEKPSTTGIPTQGDLHGRHAVSVLNKTRQKVSNLAQSGQKVRNLPKTGLEHDARPDNGRGKPVGQSSALRPCSPGGRSSVRLLRGSIPSETTGLTARRPQGHVKDTTD